MALKYLIADLFNEAFLSNMNGGLEGMWRDVVMTYFKVSRISGGVEESYKL
jgi:hypothetical protein